MEKELAQINRKIERDEHAEELKRIEKATQGLNIWIEQVYVKFYFFQT